MRKTYFLDSPRGFANEICIGIATSGIQAHAYRDAEWERISKEEAIRYLAKPGRDGWGTEWYVGVEVDGGETGMHRREIARALRVGDTIH